MDRLTLGSLFDGSGGFPLGGLLSGITPVWAAEIDRSRFTSPTFWLKFFLTYPQQRDFSSKTVYTFL